MSDIDNRETTAIASAVAAAVLAAVYWISRIGFINPATPVIEALGLSLFLIAAPFWISRAAKKREWWTSQSVIAIACIGATFAAGIAAERTGYSTAIVFVIVGFVLTLLTLARWARAASIGTTLRFIVGAVIFSVWCAGVIWGSRYKMPLFWETLSFRGNIHHDTFYYASLANMLETYGTPSTGLDGIPPVHYHFGSPLLFARWSDLLGTDVLSFYSLGYPVIVLPLFFSGLLTLATELRAVFAPDGKPIRGDWRVWLVFLAATVGFIPTDALDGLAIWNSNVFISESYLIAMAVFFFILGAGLAAWGKLPKAFLLVFLPVMLAVAGFLKISVMLLGFGLFLYLVLRLRLYRRPTVIVSLILSAVLVINTYLIVSLPAQNMGLSPLEFMRHDAAQGWQQFFPLMHLLWTWVYVVFRTREEGLLDFGDLKLAVKARRTIDIEILLVIAVLGFLPGELIAIHGGSAVYFSDVQRWIALSFIIARLPRWVKAVPVTARTRTGWTGIRLSRILAVFVAIPFAVTLFVNLAQWPTRMLRTNLTLRGELRTQESTYYPIVSALREISHLPKSIRRESLLFIPQSNRQYWSMFTSDGRCTYTPLIAPGIASVAMVDGMPASDCQLTDQYNMTVYHRRERPQTGLDVTDPAICAKASSKGFQRVIVLDAPNKELPRRRRIDCYLH